MTSATRAPLRVRSACRRSRAPRAGRALRTGIVALAAAAVVILTLFTAITGAARLLTASSAARPPVALAAPAGAGGPSLRALIGRAEQRVIIASLGLPEPRVPAPVLALATAADAVPRQRDPLVEPEITGSIAIGPINMGPVGAGSFTRAAAVQIAAPPAAPQPRADATPMPRARPTVLAALAPADAPASKLIDESVTPRTAIYDITAQAVYLPNGEKLEAHSGLGSYMDNPRHVHLRMRGSTPPNTYTLKLREKLFHGVQAIRMTPVNEDAMFGRDGILAHSYLLGPNGQSHGCVSFRDYPRFLRAFMNGEIDRIVVVARLSSPPAFYARRRNEPTRSASSSRHNAL
jgi:hypothetical protein